MIPVATYYNANAKVKRLTAEEIAFMRSITGKQVRLYPHIDVPGISYYCNVISAPIKLENKKPWINVCELRFEGVYNTPILTTITAKSITVTSPYNDSWIQGYEYGITWDSVSIASDDLVKIELFKGGVFHSTISASTVNDGSFLWTVPADQATGTDYQIKITQLSDLYVYGESNALIIQKESYILPDGVDDFVLIPVSDLGLTFSIAFKYKEWNYGSGNRGILRSSGGNYNLSLATLDDDIYFRSRDAFNDSVWSKGKKLYKNSSDWHDIVICINISTNSGTMYFDGVEGSVHQPDLVMVRPYYYKTLQLFYKAALKFKDLVITSDIMNLTDAVNYHAGTITAIDNKVLWYKCNETAASMGSAPYTDKLIDSSGNGNHGTPKNINPETFCNPPL
ncbi:MAG TPA: hypothetical protein PLH15_10650 [Spirochaetota bacterium]|nr:hypothetical protein [Spirochaetota bacterium]